MVIIDVGELSEGYDVYVVLFFLNFLNEGMRGLEVGEICSTRDEESSYMVFVLKVMESV